MTLGEILTAVGGAVGTAFAAFSAYKANKASKDVASTPSYIAELKEDMFEIKGRVDGLAEYCERRFDAFEQRLPRKRLDSYNN